MLSSSYNSMQELTAFSDNIKSTTSGGNIFESLLRDQKEDYQKPSDSKSDVKALPENVLVTAKINELYFEFGPAIKTFTDALTKLAQASDAKPVPPPIDTATNNALIAMKREFSGWDGHSVFSVTKDNIDYIGGPNGEMFVRNNDTKVDTLATSNGDNGPATIITKAENGVVQAYTDEFSVTMQKLKDGKGTDGTGTRLMTVTTNSEPPVSLALKLSDDGKGYEIVDPNHPDQSLGSITDALGIQRFDFLIREMIAARGAYKLGDLIADFNSGKTLAELSTTYGISAQSKPDDPLLLTLGDKQQPAIAQINGDDDVPIFYNFCDGETSVNGLGPAADFVFHEGEGVATTGARVLLANLTRDLSRPRNAESDAQTINDAVNTALAIAQQFLSGGSLDSAAAIGMLQDLYGVLGSIGSIAADLAQSSVSDAMNKVYIGQSNILRHPDVEPKKAMMGYEPYGDLISNLPVAP